MSIRGEVLPFVSIIIPVFNQTEALLGCLDALQQQTYPSTRFEVLVIDNGSDPPVAPTLERLSRARTLVEPREGQFAARNRGVEASRGTVLGFTDADCLPSARWIESGVNAVASLGGPGMVGGRVVTTCGDPNNTTSAELFDLVLAFPQQQYLETMGFAVTANLFTTRETFELIGAFDERLMSGGDVEWGQRVRARGLTQAYAADAIVSHPARRTLRQLLAKTVRVAGGVQRIAEHRGQGLRGIPGHAVRELILFRRVRANCGHARLATLGLKLRFAAVVWLVELFRTLERCRVRYGGLPRRT
jgi:GT2 family glycosyltransferase